MILLFGASASGKTEIGKILTNEFNISKLVTYTTREKRVNEKNGIDYYFITNDEFDVLKNEGFFFETVNYSNNMYGTAKKDISDNKYVILEPEGIKKYKSFSRNNISFFINVSEDERRTRMIKRGDILSNVDKRIAIDRCYFTELKDVDIDFVIDGENMNLYDEASEIVFKYKKAINIEKI